MIKTIISGGQTGADRAALDTAIKFNIDHGGWVPLGRKAEDGAIPGRYRMDEMPTDSYPKRTERNITDSHGTVIISRGALTGGSLLTKKLCVHHKKPSCHVDLLQIDEFEAAVILKNFISDFKIEVLNVAGSRASNDSGIYRSVKAVLETVIYMVLMESGPGDFDGQGLVLMERKAQMLCETLEEAVNFLADDMDLKIRSLIANAPDVNISSLYFSMADYIKVKLGLDKGNEKLLASCSSHSGREFLEIEDAAMVILKALKRFLEKDHVLRVVK